MLLVSGQVSVPKPLSQIQRSTLWLLQRLSLRLSFGGFGFRNEAYTGALVWGTNAKDKAEPVRVEKAFPGIISKARFGRMKRLMRSRAPKKTHPRRVGSTYLLSGLVKCKACNRAFSGQEAKSGASQSLDTG